MLRVKTVRVLDVREFGCGGLHLLAPCGTLDRQLHLSSILFGDTMVPIIE